MHPMIDSANSAGQSGLRPAGQQPEYAKNQASSTTDAPKAFDVLTKTLRDIRAIARASAEDLDSFLFRATGERVIEPPKPSPAPECVAPIQSPMHETAELLSEIQSTLALLRSIQQRVDRIA